VRISPLLVLMSVLVGASIGSWIGGLFGGFVAALLAIPAAGALQVIVREAWRMSGPPLRVPPEDSPESPAASVPAGDGAPSEDDGAPAESVSAAQDNVPGDSAAEPAAADDKPLPAAGVRIVQPAPQAPPAQEGSERVSLSHPK